jgi:hypothetical protein
MPDYDLFQFFRITVGWVATVYATIITVKSLWGWYVWLADSDRYIGLLRRYIIVQGLRTRFKGFVGDALICVLLCVVFALMWMAHTKVWAMEKSIRDVRAVSANLKH